MMNHLIPVMIDLRGRNIVVIGGGKVAARRIAAVAPAGASITVVSPELSPPLRNLAQEGQLRWIRKRFSPPDIAAADVVIAATDDASVNEQVARAARADQLVNIADDPDAGNITFPAALRRGLLTIAVSTGGASPLLARQIKRDLSQQYGAEYEEYAGFLLQCRELLKLSTLNEEQKKQRLMSLLDPDCLHCPDKRASVLAECVKESSSNPVPLVSQQA